LTALRGSTILPNNRFAERFAGLFVPRNNRFPLIGNSDRGDWLVDPLDDIRQRRMDCAPNFVCIVFDPAWLGKILRKFLVAGDGRAPVGENCSSTHACCAGIDRDNNWCLSNWRHALILRLGVQLVLSGRINQPWRAVI
jgi:hypothetical protein